MPSAVTLALHTSALKGIINLFNYKKVKPVWLQSKPVSQPQHWWPLILSGSPPPTQHHSFFLQTAVYELLLTYIPFLLTLHCI